MSDSEHHAFPLRVPQLAAVVVFGLLVWITFTARYAAADGQVRFVHLATTAFALAAVALLWAPEVWRRQKAGPGDAGQRARVDTVVVVGTICLVVAVLAGVVLLGVL